MIVSFRQLAHKCVRTCCPQPAMLALRPLVTIWTLFLYTPLTTRYKLFSAHTANPSANPGTVSGLPLGSSIIYHMQIPANARETNARGHQWVHISFRASPSKTKNVQTRLERKLRNGCANGGTCLWFLLYSLGIWPWACRVVSARKLCCQRCIFVPARNLTQ